MEPIQGTVEHTEAHPIDVAMLKYQRRTSIACTVIAWVVCIFSVLTIIGTIYIAVQLAKYGNDMQSICDSC
jgi:hypothetical protein